MVAILVSSAFWDNFQGNLQTSVCNLALAVRNMRNVRNGISANTITPGTNKGHFKRSYTLGRCGPVTGMRPHVDLCG